MKEVQQVYSSRLQTKISGLLILISFILILLIQSVYSYLSSESPLDFLDFRAGYSEIEIVDLTDDPLTVCVENTGTVPCFVRVFVEKEGTSQGLNNAPLSDTTFWDDAFSGNDFAQGDENLYGCYYCKEVIEAGSFTPVLGLALCGDELIYAECIQAEEYEDDEYLTAWRNYID